MSLKKETRGRKHIYEQTIERWYKNEYRKLQYLFYSGKILSEEFEFKKLELKKEKLEKELNKIEVNKNE